MDRTITYAQNREDLILSGFFGPDETGFYVDVGASSPVEDSVTKLFYDKGWRGVNIEPIRSHFEQLEKLRPLDLNLNIGISNQSGTLRLREYEDGTGLSTFSDDMKREYEKTPNQFNRNYKDYEVETLTLEQVFTKNKITNISFMKVDVEGFEHEVLEGNDWNKFRPEVICIEANHIKQDWRWILDKAEYKLVFFDGLNNYYVDKHKPLRWEQFSYVDAVIFKEPIVSYMLVDDLDEYDRMKEYVTKLEQEISDRNQQITNLERVMSEITPLKRHIKRQLIVKVLNTDEKIQKKLQRKTTYSPEPVLQLGDNMSSSFLLQIAKQNDSNNFVRFNTPSKLQLSNKIYRKSSRVAFKVIRKASRLIRRNH